MRYLKNISNWPDPGGQRCDMSLNYPLRLHKCNFPGKIEISFDGICQNISNWPDPGCQMMDMTQNYSLLLHKGNFPGKTKNNRST